MHVDALVDRIPERPFRPANQQDDLVTALLQEPGE
jgi:hypothetical protein